jgi:superfamily II DNA/RNA helicase
MIIMRLDSNSKNVAYLVTIPFYLSGEYVRRVGRTGRAGRRGTVTVLVHGRQVPIAKQVLGASIEGKKIEPVPELSNLESWRRSGDNE